MVQLESMPEKPTVNGGMNFLKTILTLTLKKVVGFAGFVQGEDIENSKKGRKQRCSVAKIPRHFRTPRQAQQLEPFIPSDIADVGGGLEAQALGEIGQGIGQLGETLFKIEVEKQEARDTASIADAVSKENELVFNEINNINRTVFSDVKEIQASRERLSSSI